MMKQTTTVVLVLLLTTFLLINYSIQSERILGGKAMKRGRLERAAEKPFRVEKPAEAEDIQIHHNNKKLHKKRTTSHSTTANVLSSSHNDNDVITRLAFRLRKRIQIHPTTTTTTTTTTTPSSSFTESETPELNNVLGRTINRGVPTIQPYYAIVLNSQKNVAHHMEQDIGDHIDELEYHM